MQTVPCPHQTVSWVLKSAVKWYIEILYNELGQPVQKSATNVCLQSQRYVAHLCVGEDPLCDYQECTSYSEN